MTRGDLVCVCTGLCARDGCVNSHGNVKHRIKFWCQAVLESLDRLVGKRCYVGVSQQRAMSDAEEYF